GCKHCFVYRGDSKRGIDSTIVAKTKNFDIPVQKKRNGEYKIASGTTVYTCFTSDFFVEDADKWRSEAWKMIRERADLFFLIITKRIDRLHVELPNDWDAGYENVAVCCTVENQDVADFRLPIYIASPVKHKIIICEPLLERINLKPYIGSWLQQIVVGGESGNEARICNFDWIMEIHDLCVENNISFWFKQTGARFVKNNHLYYIQRHLQHSQARKAGINYYTQINN
ncbi:MAG: phage Gp37/Gp68 family protein, partial [Prevotellaceae bacterium]|nr:phage Gp37/Gp68 family protein [Prevotellaceae bacterium]